MREEKSRKEEGERARGLRVLPQKHYGEGLGLGSGADSCVGGASGKKDAGGVDGLLPRLPGSHLHASVSLTRSQSQR